MTLDELQVGHSGWIVTVGGEGALRRRLLDMGLTPKTKVTVRKMAPMGDPIELYLRGYELTIRAEDAQKIEITGIEQQRPPAKDPESLNAQRGRPRCGQKNTEVKANWQWNHPGRNMGEQ